MKRLLIVACVAATAAAFAGIEEDLADRPQGIKIGERMTLRPYVSLSYTWDSNIDTIRKGQCGQMWIVNPGVGMNYRGDTWSLSGGAFWRYHAYNRNPQQLNNMTYGETLKWRWETAPTNEKGWSLLVGESFERAEQDDDMSDVGGRGFWRDRQTLQLSGSIERRFTDRIHFSAHGAYYMLDYENNTRKYAPLYGWDRWTAGAEAGYVVGPFTDFFVSGSTSGYLQHNGHERRSSIYEDEDSDKSRRYGNHSNGYTVHLGVQTRATERLSYRASFGWSHFDYARRSAHNSFTYSLSGRWRMADRWNMMLVSSVHYQPSEREYGSSIKVYHTSWGIGHTMIRGKLSSTFDIAYRHEEREDYHYDYDDYDEDILTFRLGANYTFNRYISCFARAEYQDELTSDSRTNRKDYDFDRWRLTIGLQLHY